MAANDDWLGRLRRLSVITRIIRDFERIEDEVVRELGTAENQHRLYELAASVPSLLNRIQELERVNGSQDSRLGACAADVTAYESLLERYRTLGSVGVDALSSTLERLKGLYVKEGLSMGKPEGEKE